MSLIFDALILLIVASTLYQTYRKGFVRSVLDLASSIISIVLSNMLAPYLSDALLPFLTEQLNKTEANIPTSALELLSYAIAFATLFAILSIVLNFLTVFISGIFKLPILNSLNKTLGLLLGCVKALIFMFLLAAIIQLAAPFINDAYPNVYIDEIIQNTFIFKHIYNFHWINFLVN